MQSSRNYSVKLEAFKMLIEAQRQRKEGDLDAAIHTYYKLLEAYPDVVPAIMNLAACLEHKGHYQRVEELFEQAVRIDPENEAAHYNLGLTYLMNGKYKKGWSEYAWRMKRNKLDNYQDKFHCPMWDGEPLAGKKIVLWTSQGIGDEILMASMFKDLMVEKAEYTIVCSRRMMPVFRRSFPDCRIVNRDFITQMGTVYEYDYQASITELGKWLRPMEESFPKWNAFLDWDSAKTKELRDKYRNGSDNLLVGIAWASKAGDRDYNAGKSIPLSDWLGVLSVPNVTFVNLQYGDAAKQAEGLPDVITDPLINPVFDVAGQVNQVAAMDLVIAVSSTPVHMAGGLGIPVWNIVPHSSTPIWYWGRDREDSPWYPSMRLFRRDSNGIVMPSVEKALAEVAVGGATAT